MFRRWRRKGGRELLRPSIDDLLEITPIETCRMLFLIETLFPDGEPFSVVRILSVACLFSGSSVSEKIWYMVCLHGESSPGALSGAELFELSRLILEISKLATPSLVSAVRSVMKQNVTAIQEDRVYSGKDVESLFSPFAEVCISVFLPLCTRSTTHCLWPNPHLCHWLVLAAPGTQKVQRKNLSSAPITHGDKPRSASYTLRRMYDRVSDVDTHCK